MKIAIDVMGGDFAPKELILGARLYREKGGSAGLVLVGKEAAIREHLPELPTGFEIVDTPEFVEMGEAPASALRKKKNTSIAVCARLVKEGKAQGFLSAGSTGAQMAASLMEIGRIAGVERPAVSVLLPTQGENGVLILDVGANVDCKPLNLVQFALMGSSYFEKMCGVKDPRVGLLNIGSEAGKGNDLAKAAFELLEKAPLNFVGNVEADHMFEGHAHVVVADGFIGNVLLKASEGVSELVMNGVKQAIAKAGLPKDVSEKLYSGLKRYRVDSPEYSGAPLLGIAGPTIVCHGKSRGPVIANAIDLSARYSGLDVIGLIGRRLAKDTPPQTSGK